MVIDITLAKTLKQYGWKLHTSYVYVETNGRAVLKTIEEAMPDKTTKEVLEAITQEKNNFYPAALADELSPLLPEFIQGNQRDFTLEISKNLFDGHRYVIDYFKHEINHISNRLESVSLTETGFDGSTLANAIALILIFLLQEEVIRL